MAESTFELKEGKFSMFKVTEKTKENSPDFTGKGLFDGNEVRLSGWVQKSKDGKTYISGTIQHKQGGSVPATPQEVDDILADPLAPTTNALGDTVDPMPF